MTELPNLENLEERIYIRATPSEKNELYQRAGKDTAKWLRWGMLQALARLRELEQQPVPATTGGRGE
jgi:hypothetical protein